MSISVGSVSVDIVPDTTKFRREMQAKLQDLTANVRVNLNAKAFDAEIAEATRDRVVDVKVNDKGSIDKTKRSTLNLVTALALLAPTAAPLTAVAIGAGAALTGLGATGILAVKGISAEMKAGTPIGLKYAGMLGGLKTDLAGLEKIAAAGVLPGVQGAVAAVSQSMPELRREVGLLSASLGSDLEPITRGILGLFQDLFPTTQSIAGGIHNLAVDFEQWANGPGGKAFAAYLAKELPIVAQTLASIATAGAHVVQALLPLGGPILQGIQGISTVISHIPVHVIEGLFLAFAGYKVITLTAAAIDGVTIALAKMNAEQAAGTGVGGLFGKIGPVGAATGVGLLPLLGVGSQPDTLTSPYQRAGANFAAEHPNAGPTGFSDFVKSAATDPKAAAQLKAYASESYKATTAQTSLAGATSVTSAKIAIQASVTAGWAKSMGTAYTKVSSLISANIGVRQAVADATASLKANGRTLDLHTQKGRDNATALLNVATAEHNKIDADVAGGKSQRTINKDFTDGRNELIHMAEKFGLSKTAATKYANSLLGIKPLINTKVVLDTTSAAAKLAALKAGFSTLQFYANQKDSGPTKPHAATGGYMWNGAIHRDSGGPVWGAGTATSDSVKAYLSNGEFVVKAATVRAVGVPFLNRLNATGQAPMGAAQGGNTRVVNIYNPPTATTEQQLLNGLAKADLLYG